MCLIHFVRAWWITWTQLAGVHSFEHTKETPLSPPWSSDGVYLIIINHHSVKRSFTCIYQHTAFARHQQNNNMSGITFLSFLSVRILISISQSYQSWTIQNLHMYFQEIWITLIFLNFSIVKWNRSSSRQQCLPNTFQYHYWNCVPDAWFLYWYL